MVKLTCLVRRKSGMSPEEFHAYWRESTDRSWLRRRAEPCVRYVQHHRSLDDYSGDDDPGYDGVTEQWFDSMDEYRAHIAEPDFAEGVGGRGVVLGHGQVRVRRDRGAGSYRRRRPVP